MGKQVLSREESYFSDKHASITIKEILQQPRLWRELVERLRQSAGDIATFMRKMESIPNLRIVFTGAGSSAFIGESMQYMLANELGLRSEVVHTTDIVAAPNSVLPDVPTLIVSFSRSGESPESVGALQYAKQKLSCLYNLVVVCKEGSSLAAFAAEASDTLTLLMPPESSDLGFAMTSSVSCMALATWCAFGWKELERRLAVVSALADSVEQDIEKLDEAARAIAAWDYDRLVYLGSGALKGLAHEGFVKSLELTNGMVNASYDAPTGLRHGPKTVINDSTLLVEFVSPLAHTRKYDVDFLKEVLSQRRKNRIVAVADETWPEIPDGLDARVAYAHLNEAEGSEICAYMKGLLFAQLLSVEKSIQSGTPTDSPCVGGEVNRVVQGVTIYPLQ